MGGASQAIPGASSAAGYPRPQLIRSRGWICLDGEWDFAFDPASRAREPEQVTWQAKIRVPFSPETSLSGVSAPPMFASCWYRRMVTPPPLAPGERLLLHFGAVDYHAEVWIDGTFSGEHEGGYTPFTIDLSQRLSPTTRHQAKPFEVVVRAEDDPLELAKPRGKQDWEVHPHSIWYPRTTGIWQTVWIEVVPAISISRLRWTSNLERWEVGLEVTLDGHNGGLHGNHGAGREGDDGDGHNGQLPPDLELRVRLRAGDRVLAHDRYHALSKEIIRRVVLSDPGVDDSRNALLWSPDSPTLIDADLELVDGSGRCLDHVSSYTALRAIVVQGDRIALNGRPYRLRMVLDQGYWPGSGMTAPDDSALLRDVELAKAMGFNGVRKHQKIEDPRYLAWADRKGLLVWEEMPSAYRFTTNSIERVTRQWMEVLARDINHPCIAAWVPFNESWGVPNLPDSPAERDWVRALYHLTKTLDPTRPVVGNDGWESVATDIIGIHDYDDVPEQIASRYSSAEARPKLFRHARPGGRMLIVGDAPHLDHPVVLSEFGGMACAADRAGTWGYRRCDDPPAFADAYRQLLDVVRSRDLLAGFCYTQFADTYQEANGLLYADRRPKFPLEEIAAATRGPRPSR